MRLRLSLVLPCGLLALLLFVGMVPSSHAARDWLGGVPSKPKSATIPDVKGDLELLVFEVENCTYCGVFRRDVLPQYQQGPTAAVAPIRFVDLNRVNTDTLNLRGALKVVPTAVLMKDGKEVDRIVGYTGPANFFKLVAHLINLAD